MTIKKLINKNERIFIAGSGMAGSAILRKLKDAGYGNKDNSGEFLIPNRDELDLLDSQKVKDWFQKINLLWLF